MQMRGGRVSAQNFERRTQGAFPSSSGPSVFGGRQILQLGQQCDRLALDGVAERLQIARRNSILRPSLVRSVRRRPLPVQAPAFAATDTLLAPTTSPVKNSPLTMIVSECHLGRFRSVLTFRHERRLHQTSRRQDHRSECVDQFGFPSREAAQARQSPVGRVAGEALARGYGVARNH